MNIQIVFITTSFVSTNPPVLVLLGPSAASASMRDGSSQFKALNFALALMLAGVNLAERVIFG